MRCQIGMLVICHRIRCLILETVFDVETPNPSRFLFVSRTISCRLLQSTTLLSCSLSLVPFSFGMLALTLSFPTVFTPCLQHTGSLAGHKQHSQHSHKLTSLMILITLTRAQGLAYEHEDYSSYEPELFPGLIYRMVNTTFLSPSPPLPLFLAPLCPFLEHAFLAFPASLDFLVALA
jgi:hypothetical protein